MVALGFLGAGGGTAPGLVHTILMPLAANLSLPLFIMVLIRVLTLLSMRFLTSVAMSLIFASTSPFLN